MAGDMNPFTGRSLRENKRSYRDFLTEDDELEEELDVAEQPRVQKTHKDPNAHFKKRKHPAHHTYSWTSSSLEMYETAASRHILTSYQRCDSPEEWREEEEEEEGEEEEEEEEEEGTNETREEASPMYWVYVDDKRGQSEASAVGHMTAEVSPSLKDPDLTPIEAAAHLQLLGESLSLIGQRLQRTKEMVTLSGSLSLLLDSLLCALAPLACLTSQVPELNSCPSHTLADTLDNIAYVMPGL